MTDTLEQGDVVMTCHLALLGDSIFDNVAYTEGGPAVIDQVCRHLPPGWRATLLAVDGDVCGDIREQVKVLPDSVTHLALSVGGNDALQALPDLYADMNSAMAALAVLTRIQQQFLCDYRAALDNLEALSLPLVVCTIYDQVPTLTPEKRTALSLFNDVILREAIRRGHDFLDLRTVCTKPEDYSPVSPIEPSSVGGEKLAKALVQRVVGPGGQAAGGDLAATRQDGSWAGSSLMSQQALNPFRGAESASFQYSQRDPTA